VSIEEKDLHVGATYRAKKPTEYFLQGPNDRTIIHIEKSAFGATSIQYDGPAVKTGRSYPTVDVEKFLKWASHEVKDDEPDSVELLRQHRAKE